MSLSKAIGAWAHRLCSIEWNLQRQAQEQADGDRPSIHSSLTLLHIEALRHARHQWIHRAPTQ